MSLQSLVEELRDFDTALLANTIGYIDPTPPYELYLSGQIQSVTPSLGPTVGVAVTCEMDTSTPSDEPASMEPYWDQLERMAATDVPCVWVVKCVGSRPDHECALGDGMGKTLCAVGCAGVVTDGRVRDVAGLQSIPLAVYSRGTVAHHCAIRVRSVDQPVDLGGVTIRPGDLIHADREGVIRVPPGCRESLPERAVAMRAFEQDVHRYLRREDVSLRQKREKVAELLGRYGFGKAQDSEPGSRAASEIEL